MKQNKPQYYDTIDVLPLYNFDKYRTTRDLDWFILGYDGRQKKTKSDKLKEIESLILDEYFKAINDTSFSNRMKKLAEIHTLQLKYNIVKSLVNRMWLGFADNDMETRLLFVKELARHGFKMQEINTKEGDAEELMRLNVGVDGIKTKIHLLEKELTKEDKIESSSLAKQLQIATIGLQYSYRLNPKEITVSEWIEITKLLEEKSKQN
jgi:hypothetical protein